MDAAKGSSATIAANVTHKAGTTTIVEALATLEAVVVVLWQYFPIPKSSQVVLAVAELIVDVLELPEQ
jgi:hypothetical protein